MNYSVSVGMLVGTPPNAELAFVLVSVDRKATHVEKQMSRGFAKKASVAGAMLFGGLALAGCEVAPPEGLARVLDMGWPDPVTPEGAQMYLSLIHI